MSSSNSNIHSDISTTPSTNNNEQDNFAQTKEDFDICSIPDSDSEEGITIYYQTPESRKRVSGSPTQRTGYENTTCDSPLPTVNEDDLQDQEIFDAITPIRDFIPSRLLTPATDDLIRYINDINLLGVNNNESTTDSPTPPEKREKELSRLREVITRSKISDLHHTAQTYPSTFIESTFLTEVQTFAAQHPSSTPRVWDFASQGGLEVYDNYLHIMHGGMIEWDRVGNSNAEDEENFHPEPYSGEEADDEEYPPRQSPPRAPVLGKRDTRDLPQIEELEETESFFQIAPRFFSRALHTENFGIGNASSIPVIPAPDIQLPIPELPREISHAYQYPRVDAWPIIALAHNIPLFPTHLLTRSSLAQLSLCEKSAQLENGCSDSVLDQWALSRHRLFLWINSGALEDGIDGGFGRADSVDLLLGLEESSEIWDYEDVEVFSRRQQGGFRRCLEWVWEVETDGNGDGDEGSVGSVGCWGVLSDELYDSFGGEEILHRSVSMVDEEEEEYVSSSSECIEEEYDAEGEKELGLGFTSPAIFPPENGNINIKDDPRLGRVVNIFRTRALQRLGIRNQDSPFRQPIPHTVFRENGIRAVDYARANAMERFERVAEEFARRGGGEGDMGQLVLSLGMDSRFGCAEVHMRGGTGSEDSGKGSHDKSPPTGPKANPPNRHPHLHPRLQAHLNKLAQKIPPQLSLPHAIKTLNQKLLLHSSTPNLLIHATKSFLQLLPFLSPASILATSNRMLRAHKPMSQKILHGILLVPAEIEALPSRARDGIEKMKRCREEWRERQMKRATRLEEARRNGNAGAEEVDEGLLTLEERIWRSMKENAFRKRRAWEYEREIKEENEVEGKKK